MEAEAM